ncbi:MAG: hypothetical protein IPM53_10415 [Anaerolineaceae bacterium]|nr:hypothetical protein [Anaerolineaceae bacterium]
MKKNDIHGLHMTIGTSPVSNLEMALEQELDLVKVAILYADSVKLYSPTYSMLHMMSQMNDLPPQLKVRLLRRTIPYIENNSDDGQLKYFLKGYERRIRENKRKEIDLAFQQQFENSWGQIQDVVLNILRNTPFHDLANMVEAERLEIHPFRQSRSERMIVENIVDCIALASRSPKLKSRSSSIDARNDALITEFVNGVSDAVTSGDTYPLFDSETSNLVRLGVKEGKIKVSDTGIRQGKHSTLAAQLFERLPLFEQASLDEILDIRSELEKYLTRYRRAVINFSSEIRSAYWDDDFPIEAEELFIREVAPAIQDLEETIEENKILTAFLKKHSDSPLILPTNAALGLIMSQNLPGEIIRGLGLGIAASSVAFVYGVYDEWKSGKKVVEQNNLYFYYQAAQKVEKRIKKRK